MAEEVFYSAKEVDKLLEATKKELLDSINDTITMNSDSKAPTISFNGQSMWLKVLRTERK